MVEFVHASLLAIQAYGTLGLVFALAFHWRGLSRLDQGSRGAGLGFRWVITPGVVALWPWLAVRCWRTKQVGSFAEGPHASAAPGRLRAAHGLAWKALAVLLPLAVGVALWWRPIDPSSGDVTESLPRTAAPGSPDASLPPQPHQPETQRSH